VVLFYLNFTKNSKKIDELMELNSSLQTALEQQLPEFESIIKKEVENNKKLNKHIESESKRIFEKQQKDFEILTMELEQKSEAFLLVLKEQMFLHEGKLLSEHGSWILEHQGNKKIFQPGKIVQVDDANNTQSIFNYNEDEVSCEVKSGDVIKSKLIFFPNGAPKSGIVFKEGKAVKEFRYDELGNVAKVINMEA
jgi:hypothetical protein